MILHLKRICSMEKQCNLAIIPKHINLFNRACSPSISRYQNSSQALRKIISLAAERSVARLHIIWWWVLPLWICMESFHVSMQEGVCEMAIIFSAAPFVEPENFPYKCSRPTKTLWFIRRCYDDKSSLFTPSKLHIPPVQLNCKNGGNFWSAFLHNKIFAFRR